MTTETSEKYAPWKRPAFEPEDAAAMQALENGRATPDQQKRALRWIVTHAAALNDWAYRPGDSDRDTNVALGRQFVGQMIVSLLKENIGQLRAQREAIERAQTHHR